MQEFHNKQDGMSQGTAEDPLTRPATAGESAVAVHPLLQGGEGYSLANAGAAGTVNGPLTTDDPRPTTNYMREGVTLSQAATAAATDHGQRTTDD